LQEAIVTTTSGGHANFHIFGALAEFEQNLIRERTRAGLRAVRVRDRKGGRPKALDAKKAELAYRFTYVTRRNIMSKTFARCWEFQNQNCTPACNVEKENLYSRNDWLQPMHQPQKMFRAAYGEG
jgi:DNA invertase Pin-like site-specific DNA recombinase